MLQYTTVDTQSVVLADYRQCRLMSDTCSGRLYINISETCPCKCCTVKLLSHGQPLSRFQDLCSRIYLRKASVYIDECECIYKANVTAELPKKMLNPCTVYSIAVPQGGCSFKQALSLNHHIGHFFSCHLKWFVEVFPHQMGQKCVNS